MVKRTAAEREREAKDARLHVADTIGSLMDFWGFKRPMGRVWTLLYVSPEPLSAAEIGAAMQMSAGAVSMTLAELVKWGAVRRAWRPGARRDYYEAETQIWKLVTRVVRERELAMVREAGAAFAAADRALRDAAEGAPAEETRRRAFERERVGNLATLAQIGESLLAALAAGKGVGTQQLRALETSVPAQGKGGRS